MPLKAEIIGRIATVDARDWDALDRSAHPFLKHAFLDALESTGCVGVESGWIPAHLVVRDADSGRLLAAVPQYLKTHSWGEFVFDWSWAQSYARAGLEYYPKQLSAIPFTPVTGPRFLMAPEVCADDAAAIELRDQLAGLLLETARHSSASGAHVNFTLEDDQAALERAGFMRRHDCRFLWRNRGYATFDDFLATFRADKRKKAKRERRKVEESGVTFRTLAGESIGEALWRVIFSFSERTFLRHGNGHYLSVEFLLRVATALPGSVVVKLAERAGRADRGRCFLRRRRRTVRPLLGLGRSGGLAALRGLLLPGHRPLHRAGAAVLRSRHAGRTQACPRFRTHAHDLGALARASWLPQRRGALPRART